MSSLSLMRLFKPNKHISEKEKKDGISEDGTAGICL